jgi:hypothetical protein
MSPDSHSDAQIVISWDLARSLYGSPTQALDHTLEVNHRALRIVGIAAPAFRGIWNDADAWVTPNEWFATVLGFSSVANSSNDLWKVEPLSLILVAARSPSIVDDLANAIKLPIMQPSNLSRSRLDR